MTPETRQKAIERIDQCIARADWAIAAYEARVEEAKAERKARRREAAKDAAKDVVQQAGLAAAAAGASSVLQALDVPPGVVDLVKSGVESARKIKAEALREIARSEAAMREQGLSEEAIAAWSKKATAALDGEVAAFVEGLKRELREKAEQGAATALKELTGTFRLAGRGLLAFDIVDGVLKVAAAGEGDRVEEFVKQAAAVAASVGGGAGGAWVGGIIGSVIGPAGTAIGAAIGGIAGGYFAHEAAEEAIEALWNRLNPPDDTAIEFRVR